MNKRYILAVVLLAVLFSACRKEKNSDVLIVEEPEEVVDTATVDIGTARLDPVNVVWGGVPSTVTVERHTDKERRLAVDENGRKYYDTYIMVRVVGKDDKFTFEKKFTKDDFRDCVASRWKKEGVLLGLPFTGIEDDRLVFRGSVGSADITSDEYDPVVAYISISGKIQTAYDHKPDFDPSEDEGV